MKSEDYIKFLDENLQLSAQGRWYTFQQDNDHKHTSKSVTVWLQRKISSTMAFNESWLKSYWKSMETIKRSNKLSVIKIPLGIRMCNHWRTGENSRKDLFKSHQKLLYE